jgi:YD repeat-containing protein
MATKKAAKKTVRAKKAPPRRTKAAATKSRSAGRSLALSSASPSFTVNNLGKSLAFYRDVLGFAVEQTWDEEGEVTGVSLRAGSVSFMIGQDDWKKGRNRSKGEGFRMFCMTDKNVDAIAKAIAQRGGKLDSGPRDQPWGVRDISVTDPDGFKITIAAPKR